MCNQSGGLIQRAVEAAGIPTVAVSTMKQSVERVKNPRTVVVRFPRGATIGPPNDIELQRRVILDALEVLRTARKPGTLVELPHRWAGG